MTFESRPALVFEGTIVNFDRDGDMVDVDIDRNGKLERVLVTPSSFREWLNEDERADFDLWWGPIATS